MKTHELYRKVTDQIVRDLENGVASWTRPWRTGNIGGVMPVNGVTGRPYSGINIPILWFEREEKGYPEPRWMTYRQAQAIGGQVRKGEKATTVVFAKRITVGEEDEERRISMLRQFHVFNVAQIDGFEVKPIAIEREPGHLDRFIEATKADIRYGGDRAFYTSKHDFVQMPPRAAFESEGHHDATLLHELCHWSGHTSRLDRQLGNRFGTKAYAAEELIAELGAAFLCAHLNIKGELRHAEYIGNWVQLLKEDDRAVFTAASKASQAADYIRAFSEPTEEKEAA